MEQLTIGSILNVINALKECGYTQEDILHMPIYIGDDDELNGIHTAWYANIISGDNNDDEYFIEMINNNRGNIKFSGKAILIT